MLTKLIKVQDKPFIVNRHVMTFVSHEENEENQQCNKKANMNMFISR